MHYIGDNTHLLVGKKIHKFKATNKNYPSEYCLRSISEKFDTIDFKEVFSKGNIYDFSVN